MRSVASVFISPRAARVKAAQHGTGGSSEIEERVPWYCTTIVRAGLRFVLALERLVGSRSSSVLSRKFVWLSAMFDQSLTRDGDRSCS